MEDEVFFFDKEKPFLVPKKDNFFKNQKVFSFVEKKSKTCTL